MQPQTADDESLASWGRSGYLRRVLTELRDVVPLSRDGSECLRFAPEERSGWSTYWPELHAEAQDEILVQIKVCRTQPKGSRRPAYMVRDLWIRAGEPVRNGTRLEVTQVRAIPLVRIEAAINRECFSRDLARLAALDESVLPSLPPVVPSAADKSRLRYLTREDVPPWLTRPAAVQNPAPTTRFRYVTGTRGDEFYAKVADAWLWLTATGADHPVRTIAVENATKQTTVNRWLKEARRRGLLVSLSAKGVQDVDLEDEGES